MNALLLYNDNISIKLINEFEEKGGIAIYFKIGNQDLANPNFSFDKTVSEKLAAIENKQFDAIFLPFSLSEENYIEFLGIQFAYHIRLTPSFNNIHTPIVFFGNETPEIINKITSQGVILFTPGIFCKQISTVLNFEEQLNLIKSKKPRITEGEYKTFLERIQVTPPANYSTHHSISNEWSILRWAKTLSLDDDADIRKIESKIGSSLYYKYLNAKYPILEANKILDSELQIKNKGRVLYLDDEAEKGWSELFSELLYSKCDLKDFDGEFGYDFKGKEKQEIIDLCFEKVIAFKPDVVILDLRLHDDDFGSINPKEISGYQILKKIKHHNKGIQVIIFSATNKIWNLLELQKEGADGFILKESPELSVDPEFTKQSIVNICKTVDLCLEKCFLKEIYNELTPLLECVKTNNNVKPKNYCLKIQQGKLELYKELLESAEFLLYSNPHNLKYTFLQLILIIEDIVKSFYINSSSNSNHYVEIGLERKLCLEKKKKTISLKLNPIEKWNKYLEGIYLIEENVNQVEFNNFNCSAEKVFFNYRLNCVLYFVYNIDLNQASKFSQLYRLRSSSVAHIGNSDVNDKDILNSIELLNILISYPLH